jgi:hypothetical protein
MPKSQRGTKAQQNPEPFVLVAGLKKLAVPQHFQEIVPGKNLDACRGAGARFKAATTYRLSNFSS